MKRFNFLTGDINWKQYGGTFYHKEETYTGSKEYTYTFIEVINMPDAVGSDATYTYNVSVKSLSTDCYSEVEVNRAMECSGYTFLGNGYKKHDELVAIEAMLAYGYGDTDLELTGNNISKLMREAHAYIGG